MNKIVRVSLFICLTIIMPAQLLAQETSNPSKSAQLRIIAFGAHPDDCEIKAGGVAVMWAGLGHKVKFVSTTNGDIGHWQMAGGPLAKRRKDEVQAAAEILGIETEVLDIHDGELMPTLENRKLITKLIREWKADIVLGPRTNDYHPDHRYTGILVQDAAYRVTVPFFCPDVPALKSNPVFLYYSDNFQKPNPFEADIVVPIDSVIDKKLKAISLLDSQFVEGGCGGNKEQLPKNKEELAKARERVCDRFRSRFKTVADKYRDRLVELYGKEAGQKIAYAETFEICEYGSRPSKDRLKQLFPFLKENK